MGFNKRDSDLITIGQYISFHVCDLDNTSSDWFLQVGKDYTKFAHYDDDDESIHKVMKMILGGFFGGSRVNMLRFIRQYDKIPECITKNVEFRYDSVVCKIRLFKNVSNIDRRSEPFYVQDFISYCDTFIVLDGLMSCTEDAGRYVLNVIKNLFSVPILIQAGFLFYGDYEVEYRDGEDSGI